MNVVPREEFVLIRLLIKRVRAGTECAIGEEQRGFRQGRLCIDKVVAVRQVYDKYIDVFLGVCGFANI